MDRPGRLGAALALLSITAVVVAGCGGKETDVSGGIDSYNERLTQQGIPAKLECPKEVDGGEGTKFECTLKANQGGKEEKVQMEVQKEGDERPGRARGRHGARLSERRAVYAARFPSSRRKV